MADGPAVALVHDYMVATGGAERVLVSLHRLFPEAPIYTALHRPDTTLPEFQGMDVRALWPDRLPVSSRTYRPLIPAYALAFERLRLSDFDLVLSASSGFAKSAGAGARARACYCYTPPRFVWPLGASSERAGTAERLGRPLLRPWLRRLDLAAAARVDQFAVTSRLVASRVAECYRREATVVHPPIEIRKFAPGGGPRSGYLVVGRLAPYRRFDHAVIAAGAMGRRLTVAGTGADEVRLRRLAGDTVTFAGRVDDATLEQLYQGAQGLLVPGEEDWGLAALEANACGCPVVAAAVGGSLETVVDGVTGILYDPEQPRGLERAIERLESTTFDPAALRAHAEGFSEAAFHSGITAMVERALPG